MEQSSTSQDLGNSFSGISKKTLIGVSVLVIAFGASYWLFTEFSSKEAEVPRMTATKPHVKDKNKIEQKLSKMSDETTPDNSEFYSRKYSGVFKEAYLNYRKARLSYGEMDATDRTYYKDALLGFVAVYNDKTGMITDEEKSAALNLMNVIYIATSWDDKFMVSTLYSVSPFKEMYEKNVAEIKREAPSLEGKKDTSSIYDQTALVGAASQETMNQINKISYAYNPIGYSLMRRRMNGVAYASRIYPTLPEYKGLSQLEMYKKYLNSIGGLKGLEEYKANIDALDKKGKLFAETGPLEHEIYIMRVVTLWDPLTSLSTSQKDKMAYRTNMKEDFKKAVDMVVHAERPKDNVIAMISLFYVAHLIDYGITNKTAFSADVKASYVREASQIVDSLVSVNTTAFQNYLIKGEAYSHKPTSIPATEEYYGGSPYYQVRLLAETDASLKKYLKSLGWAF